MSYKVSYTGSDIDSILQKAQSFEVSNEAWTVIPSTVTTLELSKLFRVGNYIYSGTVKFPTMDKLYGITSDTYSGKSIATSSMIFVRYLNNNYYQYLHLDGIADQHKKELIIVWIRQTDYTYIPKFFFLDEEFTNRMGFATNIINDIGNVKFDKQIRYFTSDKSFEYYDERSNKYISFLSNALPTSIYGTVTDIFNYVDSHIIDADFTGHMNNSTIHTTVTEKASWDVMEHEDNAKTAAAAVQTEIEEDYLPNKMEAPKYNLIAANKTVELVGQDLSIHSKDNNRHPSSTQKASWDSKADGNHTHTKAQITIDASNVTGTFTADQIVEDAKERQVTVANQTALLALTKTSVQNGDWVLLNDTNYPLYYVVIDDTKLGTMDAFQQLTSPNIEDKSWAAVQNKPTTFEELGITDAMPNSDTDDLIDNLNNGKATVTSGIEELKTVGAKYTGEMQDKSQMMETMIDLIDAKMQVISEVLSGM